MSNSQKPCVLIIVALCSIITAGGLLASNMGFVLPYRLQETGTNVSKSGTNSLALPYFRRPGVNTAFDLIKDIEGGGPPFSKVLNVSKYLEATDALQTYGGRAGAGSMNNFALVAGEGYRVQMTQGVNYIIVGSHDPSFVRTLSAKGAGSNSGTNDFAPPYNINAVTAFDLIKDIEGGGPPFSKVLNVSKFLQATDTLQTYTGRAGAGSMNDFALFPGESYRIQMSVSTTYIPSHY